MKTIGVDLGGTNVRVGLIEKGTVLHKVSGQLRQKDSLSATLGQLIELIRPFLSPEVSSIGIGVPSVVDLERGIVYNVANIPSWQEVPLRDILEEEFDRPVFVNNDVNCFILGEHQFGLARGCRSAVGLAIGTGLGSGVIIDNQLYTGSNCGAGEIGLLPYRDKTMESYASTHFFESIHGTSAWELSQAAGLGAPDALALWAEFGGHFGQAIKAVLYTYDPEVIVLGGSIAKAYPYFRAGMLQSMADFAYPTTLQRLRLVQSENESIALLGASVLVHQLA
ncbi:ROK family protein [Rudanella paleaurantiibacter]|uniref:ROK family protein n=1 Tax=Rudanella paleaurantiibacter TaxID=2614655 RepID=A0A7J5U0P6_9BACT|nr:ROK family protein [Rudanella paleaurantiibacter]KAB7731332.1 ROK family protein [Rudanella paleaurantiibacter]